MARLPYFPADQLTGRQRELFDQSPRRANRTEVNGPIRAFILSPDFARTAQDFGQFVQYQTPFEQRLREIAILVTAQTWSCEYEWFAHARDAVREGVSPENVEAIRTRREPRFERDDEALVYDIATALHRDRRIPDALYQRATAMIGEDGLLQLMGVIGYYTFLAMIINGFELEIPGGAPKQLAD